MWQSPLFKISQPEQATCHNPPLTKLTTQILPRHHLLHLTHETLTLIFLLSFQPPQPPPHLFMLPHHRRPATMPHLHLHVSPATTTHRDSAHLLHSLHHHNSTTSSPSSPQFRHATIDVPAPPLQICERANLHRTTTAARLHTSYCISTPSVRASLHLFEPSICNRTHLHQCIHHGSTCRNHEAATQMQQQPSRRKRNATSSATVAPHASVSAIASPEKKTSPKNGSSCRQCTLAAKV